MPSTLLVALSPDFDWVGDAGISEDCAAYRESMVHLSSPRSKNAFAV